MTSAIIELEALAVRLETEAPNRQLDAAIAKAVGWTMVELVYVTSFDQDWHGVPPGDGEGAITIPAMSGSLDVAMSLVPAGRRWSVGVALDGTFEASVWQPGSHIVRGADISRHGHSSSPAGALAAAALRAHAAPIEEGLAARFRASAPA